MSAHVSLVGGGGSMQMIFDKSWHEPRDGGKFLTALGGFKERVADGGEHMHWWMYPPYSAADDVASTLAAMAMVGSAVGSLETAGGPVAWALEP